MNTPWWSGYRKMKRAVRSAHENSQDAAACMEGAADAFELPPPGLGSSYSGESQDSQDAWTITNLHGHALTLAHQAEINWIEALVALILWVKEGER